jgi:TPR repeat protein
MSKLAIEQDLYADFDIILTNQKIINSKKCTNFYTLGIMYEQLKEYKTAERYYLIAINELNTYAMISLGLLYIKTNYKLQEASKYFMLAYLHGNKEGYINSSYKK